ncbi:unnamed protein product [Sphagnum balticum]
MGTTQTKARYGGTSTEDEGKTEEATDDESGEDEELYGPFGSLLLLQLIHDLFRDSRVLSNDVMYFLFLKSQQRVSFDDGEVLGVVRMVQHDLVPYLQQDLPDLPPSLQKYLSEPIRSWKRFLKTNLRVNEIDLSRLVTSFVREHVKWEVYADLRYLIQLSKIQPRVRYLPETDHDTGQRM